MPFPITFTAPVISGAGRGKELGIPTMNLDVSGLTEDIETGVYAGYAVFNNERKPAAIHIGPRPVFRDSDSCEVHVIDTPVDHPPAELTIELVQQLRDVQDFPSVKALVEQLQQDIDRSRAILLKHTKR